MLPKPSLVPARRFKHRLRSGIDHAARWTGILRWLERRATRGHTILMYHRVLPDDVCRSYPLPTLAMPIGAFREQVEFLASHCEVLPVGELAGRPEEQSPSARPRVSITFDDGYRDNYEIAAPILEAAGVRATFFVTTGFVETGGPLWFDLAIDLLSRAPSDELAQVARAYFEAADAERLCARSAHIPDWMELLKTLAPGNRSAFLDEIGTAVGSADMRGRFDAMTPAHVAELARRGHEIGSHTVHHPLLPQLSDPELDLELAHSMQSLTDWIGRAPAGFCYPNGDHSERVVDAVKRAGYRYACTVEPGINMPGTDPLRMRRMDITPASSGVAGDRCDLIAFRSEFCGLHQALRA
jgi:peptidoglycan/xylan/chitin deacetylase (PgdA/CDA1 family)